MKDEGIGVHVVKELEKTQLPNKVEVIDAGTCALTVLSSIKDIDKLIIIDAAKAGNKPGSIYRIHPNELSSSSSGIVSLHQISLCDALAIIKKTHKIPSQIIIGVEPKEIDWGSSLSPEVQNKIPDIIKIVLSEIKLQPSLKPC